MHRERSSTSLLAELFDHEEDAYRLALREADRIGSAPPAVALRSIVGHANDALEDLRGLAAERRVRLGSAGSLLFDTLHRVRDIVADQLSDEEHGYQRALTTLRDGLARVRCTREAARSDGDEELAVWCERWLSARERFVADATDELAWFALHPVLLRAA